MRNILTYYFKKRLPLFIVVLSLSVITTIVYMVSTRLLHLNETTNTYILRDTGMIYLTAILLLFCIFYSIFEFSFKMKRTSCDLFYSLPIKRRSLFLSKYIIGLAQILILFIVNFLIVLIFGLATFAGKTFYNQIVGINYSFNFGYYFMFLGIMIVVGALLYSWFAFFFTRCNTTIDGIINMVLSSTVLCAISIAFYTMLERFMGYDHDIIGSILASDEYIPFISMFVITSKINYLVQGFTNLSVNVLPLVITWTLCLASLALFIIFSSDERAENTFEISDSYFSYKVFLPAMIVSLLAQCKFSDYVFIAILVGGYIGYVIHNRHFKLRKYDWISFIVSSGVGLILMYIGSFIWR